MTAGTREAIEEQLRLGQELRRRVDRMSPAPGSGTDASGESESDSDDSVSGSDAEGAPQGNGLSRKAADEARAAAAAILEGELCFGVTRHGMQPCLVLPRLASL